VKIQTLQENLRNVLWERIRSGGLTGLRLAERAGFQQAHISNFLNRKRGLSLEGMDRIMAVEKISVLDLLDPGELNRRASTVPSADEQFESVALVEGEAATTPIVRNMDRLGVIKFHKAFLRRLRAEPHDGREKWERFLAVKADGREGMSMFPRLLPGATVLLDRHYNSLRSYRRNESNMYGVQKDGTCTLKYVELAGGNLVLRPHNHAYPVEVVPLGEGRRVADYLIGRVCYVGIEA
jgi:transcriptional regulator with XRE-family HTH domain